MKKGVKLKMCALDKFVGDNVDKNIKPRYQSQVYHIGESLQYSHGYAVKDRVIFHPTLMLFRIMSNKILKLFSLRLRTYVSSCTK